MLQLGSIPETWQVALAVIQRINPEAVIGGGALRDLDNGRHVKDIDIFVRGTSDGDLLRTHDLMTRAGIKCEAPDPGKFYPVGDGNDVIGYFTAHCYGLETPLQIIVVNHDCAPEKIVERFDYGICRIAFDGRSVFHSPDYLNDQRACVFRLCIDFDTENPRLPNAIHRYARLTQKYIGWPWRPFISPYSGRDLF